MSDGQTRETTVTSSPSDDHSAIRSVHDRWVETNNRNPAETELTPGRVAIIRARLSDCTFDQVIRAVEACGDSPYHQGQNPSGNVYNDLEQHILCSREKVEWWLHRTPPVKSADTFDYDTFFDRWEEENRQPTREELLAEAHERRKRRQEREARENELTAVA